MATTSSLVEFLRDVALARQRRIRDVSEYETVLWLHDVPNEVTVDVDAGPGEAMMAIPLGTGGERCFDDFLRLRSDHPVIVRGQNLTG